MTLTIGKSQLASTSNVSGPRIRPPSLSTLLLRAAERNRGPGAVSSVARNDAVHFIIVVAIIVLLAIAATIAAATVIMCASQGGVLSSYFSLDPWTIRIDCVRI
jgi:hypothetical protein